MNDPASTHEINYCTSGGGGARESRASRGVFNFIFNYCLAPRARVTRSPPSPELIISRPEARVAVGAPLPLRLDYGDSRKTALPSQGVLYCNVMVAAFSQTPAVAIDGSYCKV